MTETTFLEDITAGRRFRRAPCLEEREQYLFHLMRRGYGADCLRSVSGDILRVVRFLGLRTLRTVAWENVKERVATQAPIAGQSEEHEEVRRLAFSACGEEVALFSRAAGRFPGSGGPVRKGNHEIHRVPAFLRDSHPQVLGSVVGVFGAALQLCL